MKLDTNDESDELSRNICQHQNQKCFFIDNYSESFKKIQKNICNREDFSHSNRLQNIRI